MCTGTTTRTSNKASNRTSRGRNASFGVLSIALISIILVLKGHDYVVDVDLSLFNIDNDQTESGGPQYPTYDTHNNIDVDSTHVKKKWAIVMASTNEAHFKFSLQQTKIYADQHGYDIFYKTFIDDPHSESEIRIDERYQRKITTILEAFDKGYENVYWKDTDILIIDCNSTLENQFHQEEVAKWKRLKLLPSRSNVTNTTNMGKPPQLDIIFTGDTKGFICTGNMLLRNTQWTRDILKRSLEIQKAIAPRPWHWHDQSAIQYTLLGEPKRCREDLMPCISKCLRGGCETSFPELWEKHFSIRDMMKVAPFPHYRQGPSFGLHITCGYNSTQKLEMMKKHSKESTCYA